MSISPIRATIRWSGDSRQFQSNQYPRKHQWKFDGGSVVAASSSPDIVPVPLSDPSCVDPEEAFVAAISSCHMLWFLALAAKAGWSISEYEDQALGEMQTNSGGKRFIAQVTLRPQIRWGEDGEPSGDEIAQLHQRAHEECFIANSVITNVTIE